MNDSDDAAYEQTMDMLISTVVGSSLTLILSTCAILVLLKLSFTLYRLNPAPWSKVPFPCLLASLVIIIIEMAIDYWADWPYVMTSYLLLSLQTLGALLFLLSSIAFLKLVNQLKLKPSVVQDLPTFKEI